MVVWAVDLLHDLYYESYLSAGYLPLQRGQRSIARGIVINRMLADALRALSDRYCFSQKY